jgi:hypothetical protein
MGAEMAAGAAIGCVTGAAETETAAVVIGGAAGTAVEPGGGTILGAAIGGAAGTPLAVGNWCNRWRYISAFCLGPQSS